MLAKFNLLGDVERNGTQLWQSDRFGNGLVKDVFEIRQKILAHTIVISLSLHFMCQDSQGRMEIMISRQREMKEIWESVTLLFTHEKVSHEGSVFSNHPQDDIAWWRTFRHNLGKNWYKSKALEGDMDLIQR
jgi:hypothetical protein